MKLLWCHSDCSSPVEILVVARPSLLFAIVSFIVPLARCVLRSCKESLANRVLMPPPGARSKGLYKNLALLSERVVSTRANVSEY